MKKLNYMMVALICFTLASCGDREVSYSYRLINVTEKEVMEAKIISDQRDLSFGVLVPMKHKSVSINTHILKNGGTLEWVDSEGKKNSVELESGPPEEENEKNHDVYYHIDIVGKSKIRFESFYVDPNKKLW